jgi:hypothetical protein
MKTSQATQGPKSDLKSEETALKRPESGFYVEFGVIARATVDADSEKAAIEYIEAVARNDYVRLLNFKSTELQKFEVCGSGALCLAQTVDVRLKEGSTVNKVALKKATSLNPPADVKDAEIKKLIEWFDVDGNMRWASPEHVQWVDKYRQWFKGNGYLTKGQLKGLKGTKQRIKYRDKSHGRSILAKVWNELVDAGESEKAKEFYEKHLKKYD